jgi:hypothetical protein
MTYEQKDNSGSFFENNRKQTQSHPDFTGKVMVGGVMYWMSIWNKTSGKGEPFWSCSFTEMQQQGGAPAPRQQAQRSSLSRPPMQQGLKRTITSGKAILEDDEIPFD